MTIAPREKLQDLLQSFDVAMLVTRTLDGGLRSRPMALADVEPNGVLWFFTQASSGKIDDISQDIHVNVTMQSQLKFVSISGTVRQVEDRAKVNVALAGNLENLVPQRPG